MGSTVKHEAVLLLTLLLFLIALKKFRISSMLLILTYDKTKNSTVY